MAAHILAKWTLQNVFVGSFDLGHCPSCLVVIRKEAFDFVLMLCAFFNKIFQFIKK